MALDSSPVEDASRRIRVLALSDGKPGHYHQTEGILSHLRDADAERLRVVFRSKRADNWLRAQVMLFRRRLPEPVAERALRDALTPECYEQLSVLKRPDIVFSTGSSVAAPNLLLAQRFDAKAVVCTRPSPIGTTPFDLAILARHQWTKATTRVVRVLGVPNHISPETVAARRQELERDGDVPPTVGLLFGGDDKRYRWTVDAVSAAINGLVEAARATNRRLAVVTSRRTPPAVEAFLKSRLLGDSVCVYTAFSSESPPKVAPVLTLFALCEWIAVTVDSFSMVCEACSSGRPVALLTIPPRRHDRYAVAFDAIASATGMIRVPVKNVRDTAVRLANATWSGRALCDAQTAAAGIRRWFDGECLKQSYDDG
jgi:hypothetical protein